MKIIADINKVELRDFEPLMSGAYRDKTIDVELSPEYDGLSVWAIFDRQSVKVEGGKCYTPTLERGTCSVGIYAVRLNSENEIDLRYSPAPALINIEQGSYNSSLNSATTPTESEVERIYALIDEAIKAGMLKGDKGDKGDKGEKGDRGEQGIQGDKGDKGDKGDPGTPGKDGYTPIKGVDYFDGAKGDKGDKGEKGDRGEQGVKGDRGEQGIQGLPGTTVYSELSDKPSINDVILEGNKTLSDLGIVNYDDTEIKEQIAMKQDTLTAEQLKNISAVPNKIDKTAVGNDLKFADGKLQLDIPVATADTGYGG